MMIVAFYSMICFFLTLNYWIIFQKYKRGWNKIENKKNVSLTGSLTKFSIIIPCRNEEQNIEHCLDSIISQKYLMENIEIIIIDDCSTDQTLNKLNEYDFQGVSHNIIDLRKEENHQKLKYQYKKGSIDLGIEKAQNPYIITTDADTIRNNAWLISIHHKIKSLSNNPKLISAPVQLTSNNPKNYFEQWQILEFAGLNAIGGASIENKDFNMCNGANLIYLKSAYMEVDGFKGVEKQSSGDDEYLMHKIAQKYPEDVHFLKDPNAMVYTNVQVSLADFLNQRKRWVSKSTTYVKKRITYQLTMVWAFCFCLVINFMIGIFQPQIGILFLVMFIIKILTEIRFYSLICPFYKIEGWKINLIQSSFLHGLYVSFIAFYAQVGTFKWKDRVLKR